MNNRLQGYEYPWIESFCVYAFEHENTQKLSVTSAAHTLNLN